MKEEIQKLIKIVAEETIQEIQNQTVKSQQLEIESLNEQLTNCKQQLMKLNDNVSLKEYNANKELLKQQKELNEELKNINQELSKTNNQQREQIKKLQETIQTTRIFSSVDEKTNKILKDITEIADKQEQYIKNKLSLTEKVLAWGVVVGVIVGIIWLFGITQTLDSVPKMARQIDDIHHSVTATSDFGYKGEKYIYSIFDGSDFSYNKVKEYVDSIKSKK